MRSEQGGGRLNLSLNAPALHRQLAALLGQSPRVPIEFAPRMSLEERCGRRLGRYLRLAVEEFQRAGAMPWTRAMAVQFEQVIMTELLLAHGHNYSDALRAAARPIAPRDVRRAIDYAEAYLAEPVTIADLAAVAGVPGRTLFQHFREFKGVSPMRYLRNARFERVRRALLQAEPEEDVTAIAFAWGFTHLGRFAVEYRRRFGERPSDTIRRYRRLS